MPDRFNNNQYQTKEHRLYRFDRLLYNSRTKNDGLRIIQHIVFILILMNAMPVQADTAFVLVSKDIRPYRQALDGLSSSLQQTDYLKLDIQFLDKIERKGSAALLKRIADIEPSVLISIGPEAIQFFQQELRPYKVPLIYTMVLNPERLLGQTPNMVCGISLNIPIPIQLREMINVMPDLKRIGLLYNPVMNHAFFVQAQESAKASQLIIVPLQISSSRDIPSVLNAHWEQIDGLWLIPDQTLKSETLFQFIIKQALIRNIPVIGYNRFFLESGALLSFIMDYEDLGRQTAELTLRVLAGVGCHHPPPRFSSEINVRVAKKIPIRFYQENDPEGKKTP